MAILPRPQRPQLGAPRLARFDPAWAVEIPGWIRNPQETYWLAPHSPPPITAAEVVRWQTPAHVGHFLCMPDSPRPVGYGEVNCLNEKERRYWLGHLIIDPEYRGRGLGRELTWLLIRRALDHHAARSVTLVVFPDNHAAIAAYRAAGMSDDGSEAHTFENYGTTVLMRRMAVLRLW